MRHLLERSWLVHMHIVLELVQPARMSHHNKSRLWTAGTQDTQAL